MRRALFFWCDMGFQAFGVALRGVTRAMGWFLSVMEKHGAPHIAETGRTGREARRKSSYMGRNVSPVSSSLMRWALLFRMRYGGFER